MPSLEAAAAASAGEYQEDAKKLPQIINLESKLNKQKHYATTLIVTHKSKKNAQKISYVKNNTTSK